MRRIAHPNTQFIKSSLKDIFFKSFSQSGVFSTRTAPLVRVFLEAQLIQMCGYIERKCECILWEIGYHDFEERFKIFENSVTGIRVDQLKKIYKKFKDEINNDTDMQKITNQLCEPWHTSRETQIQNLRDSLDKEKRDGADQNRIETLKKNINYLSNKEEFFIAIENCYQRCLDRFFNDLPNYSIYPEIAYSLGQCSKDIDAEGFLKKIHFKRNEIAHFLNFFQNRSTYSHITPDFNYFTAYSVLIALDKVLTLMCKYYFQENIDFP